VSSDEFEIKPAQEPNEIKGHVSEEDKEENDSDEGSKMSGISIDD